MDQQNLNFAYKKHHFWRTFFAAIFGSIALLLIFISIFALWFTHTITNTNTYVNTVAPLARDKDIQAYVAKQTAQSITDNLPIQDAANKLLPGINTMQTTQILKEAIKPIVERSVQQVVQSDQFATIWRNTNASVHAQFIAQLDTAQPSNQLVLDLTPVINGVIAELKGTQTGSVVGDISIKPGAGLITIKNDTVTHIRQAYRNLKFYTMLFVVVAAVFAGLAIMVSVHHAKVFRRVLLLSGFGLLFGAAAIDAAGRYTFTGNNAIAQNAAVSFGRILLHNLKMVGFITGLSLIAIAFLHLWIEHFTRAKRLARPSYTSASLGAADANTVPQTPKTSDNLLGNNAGSSQTGKSSLPKMTTPKTSGTKVRTKTTKSNKLSKK